jgi:hypothetical protein
MRSQCGPPEFDEQDFSKFDLSRWHLDGLTLDSVASAIGGLAEKLFTTDEWRTHFDATLPAFQGRTQDFFKQQLRDLQQERAETADDFEKRAKAAEQSADDFRRSTEVTAAPVVLDAVPDVFQGSVRIVSDKDPQLGLPGVRVQVLDPKNEKTVLVETTTDLNGNAILAVPPELAKERDEQDVTVQVVDATGKPLVKVAKAICIRVGQTEERVIKVPESAAIEENKNQALETRSERETRARQLAGRGDVLRREAKQVLDVIDCRVRDTEAIIDELEATGSVEVVSLETDTPPGTSSPAASSQPSSPTASSQPSPKTSSSQPASPKTGSSQPASNAEAESPPDEHVEPPEDESPPRRPRGRKPR